MRQPGSPTTDVWQAAWDWAGSVALRKRERPRPPPGPPVSPDSLPVSSAAKWSSPGGFTLVRPALEMGDMAL